MSEQAQEQALIIRALQVCNGPPSSAGPRRRSCQDGLLLTRSTLLTVAVGKPQQLAPGHNLFIYVHMAQGGAAAESRPDASPKVRVRLEARLGQPW